VRLDATDMKMKIMKSPNKCWKDIMEFIPKLQYEKLDALHEILKVESAKVSRTPTNIA
jgi:hypothetical protein